MNTTYPDGSVLESTALTIAQIQTLFQLASAQMLGILTAPWPVQFTLTSGQPVAAADTNNLYSGQIVSCAGVPEGTLISSIGTGAVTFSNPATLDGVQVGSVTDPNAFSKVRIGWQTQGQPAFGINDDVCFIRCTPVDSNYSKQRDITRTDADDTTITETDVFTRAWRTYWTFYGPNSLDNSRAVRSALIKIPYFDDLLGASNLYVNPSIDEPQRVPELFQGEWWERVDLGAMFNEQITENFVVNAVASVQIIGETSAGVFTTFTVELP